MRGMVKKKRVRLIEWTGWEYERSVEIALA